MKIACVNRTPPPKMQSGCHYKERSLLKGIGVALCNRGVIISGSWSRGWEGGSFSKDYLQMITFSLFCSR